VYSNLGVSLLGRLLAHRAGIGYEELLQSRVLKPLGMTSTAVVISREEQKRLAPGHDRFLAPVDTWNLTNLPGSGGLRSSVNDMLTFMAANLGYVDSPLTAAMAYQRDTRYPGNASRALAWSVGRTGSVEVFGHDGGKEGYRSALILNPEARTGVVVLTNARTDDRPFDLAMHLLTGRAMKPAPAAPPRPKFVRLSARELDALAGRYRRTPDSDIIVARYNRRLYVDFVGDGIVTLDPTSPHEFVSNVEDLQITFEPTGMVIREGDKESRAARIE
jgi:CubicO group peptidase (beta-lactamase class C family)